MEKELTLKAAAEILGCSEQTVRRRVLKGDYQARKEVTETGARWLIPESQISAAVQTVEVVPVQKQLSLIEIQSAIEQAVTTAVERETSTLKQHIERLENKLEAQGEMLNSHYTLVDTRLRQIMERGSLEKKSWWSKLFG